MLLHTNKDSYNEKTDNHWSEPGHRELASLQHYDVNTKWFNYLAKQFGNSS
jgi:hypothetical protein